MPSPVTRSPGTLASDGTGSPGTAVWANPSNAAANDGAATESDIGLVEPLTEYLKATNFSFTVPADATVNGILVEIEKDGSQVFDKEIRLIKAGSFSGDDKADFLTDWSSAAGTYTSHGGAADMWGTTWTPAQINASNFGIGIAAEYGGGGGSLAAIDHVRITVYYTEAGGGSSSYSIGSMMGVG